MRTTTLLLLAFVGLIISAGWVIWEGRMERQLKERQESQRRETTELREAILLLGPVNDGFLDYQLPPPPVLRGRGPIPADLEVPKGAPAIGSDRDIVPKDIGI